jgi:hypothetical protein
MKVDIHFISVSLSIRRHRFDDDCSRRLSVIPPKSELNADSCRRLLYQGVQMFGTLDGILAKGEDDVSGTDSGDGCRAIRPYRAHQSSPRRIQAEHLGKSRGNDLHKNSDVDFIGCRRRLTTEGGRGDGQSHEQTNQPSKHSSHGGSPPMGVEIVTRAIETWITRHNSA